MKQFFKFMFATIAGIFISFILIVLILVGVVAGIASGEDDEAEALKDKSVLELKLDYMIPERSSKNPFDNFNLMTMEGDKHTGLNDLVKSIRYAAKDDKIKGIYLDVSYSPNSYATLEEIREALLEFKKSKKFIIAYGEVMEEHSYYIASVADKIYLNPAGELLINGFSYQEAYIKNLFDKIGVQPQLIRHGKYKAAGEPLIADKMSDANRQQIEAFAGELYRHFLSGIAQARKKSVEEVTQIASKLLIQSPEDASKLGMIDGAWYEDQVMSDLRKRLEIEEKEKINFVLPNTYARSAKDDTKASSKNKIAVVYVSGDIVSGEGDEESAGSESLVESIEKARKDSSVKAIVLRVNSPGGSALASDVIWREVVLAKKAKPVIVSFGAVAASGGYYVATPADVIVAEPNTITGSIGVFAVVLNAQKLLNDKLGIKFETVKFGDYADLGTPDRPLTAGEQTILQHGVDRVYEDFVKKVAEGRKMSKDAVDSIAQGRVWAGTDALKLGLVDELGGMDKALAIAIKKANVEDYRIVSYPELKDPFDNLVKSFSDEASMYITKKQLGDDYRYFEMAKKAVRYNGMQARMLYDVEIR